MGIDGEALIQCKKYEDAFSWYSDHLTKTPDDPILISGAAISLWFLGKTSEAVARLECATIKYPSAPDLVSNLGWLLNREREFSLARRKLTIALHQHPDHIALRINLGFSLIQLGQFDEAIECFEPLRSSQPMIAEAVRLLGVAYHRTNQLERAAACFDALLRDGHRDLTILLTHSDALARLGRLDESLGWYNLALSIEPRNEAAVLGKARVLGALGRADDGLVTLDTLSRASDTSTANTFALRSLLLAQLGRGREALEACEIAARSDKSPEMQCQLGFFQATVGDYKAGFSALEARRMLPEFIAFSPDPTAKSWVGNFSLTSKRLLVYQEQGHGDMIQCLRYLPMLVHQAREVTIAVPTSLASLTRSVAPGANIISVGDTVPPYDCYIPFMSLPYAFGTTLETIPRTMPYITVTKSETDRWSEKLSLLQPPLIGIVWKGEPKNPRAKHRDIPAAKLTPFGELPVNFISLQRPPNDDLAVGQRNITEYGHLIKDFMDAAALISKLDLIIAVDTAYAHVAGALNVPTWILLDVNADWRWGRNVGESPWYPSARLFRQKKPGDWSDVIETIKMELLSKFRFPSH
ncbi:hypothetical protein BC2230_120096 [Burkholderia cepacia]|uniref:tetratricopeptide repeat protein n=1 Tax=Burkholderia cepacia TaxID=292 RepID=UPI0039A56C7A